MPIPVCDGSIPAGYVLDGTDCDDSNRAVNPGAPEICNGIDDDCSGTVDDGGGSALCNDGNPCTDDSCNGLAGCGQTMNSGPCDDGDACTTGDACGGGICLPGVPAPPPAEVGGVQANGQTGTTVTWTGMDGGVVYDVAGSLFSDLRLNGTRGAVCLSNDVAGTSFVDGRPDPKEGDGFYYLVRAQSACGAGTYGFDSESVERGPASACP